MRWIWVFREQLNQCGMKRIAPAAGFAGMLARKELLLMTQKPENPLLTVSNVFFVLIVRVGGRHGRHPVNGSVIAALLPEEKMGEVIEKVIEWYNDRGKGKGRVRIGDILMNKC